MSLLDSKEKLMEFYNKLPKEKPQKGKVTADPLQGIFERLDRIQGKIVMLYKTTSSQKFIHICKDWERTLDYCIAVTDPRITNYLFSEALQQRNKEKILSEN